MLSYIADFSQYRTLLQQTVSIQMASGVSDLVSKMDILLSSVFEPTSDWEKTLAGKTRHLGAPSSWMQDTETLAALIVSSEESSMDVGMASGAQLQKIRMELAVSLDVLCDRNAEMFDLKLSMHSTKIQEAIANSAHHVVKTLSGPYDRLHNKVLHDLPFKLSVINITLEQDLRELWKEMVNFHHVDTLRCLIFFIRIGSSVSTTSCSQVRFTNTTATNSWRTCPWRMMTLHEGLKQNLSPKRKIPNLRR